MSQKAVIFTANRVVRRLTSDAVAQVAADETAVDLGVTVLDLGGGPWKLSASAPWTLSTPTQQEIDDADVDPVRVAALKAAFLANYDTLIDAITAATSNAQLLTAVKAWAVAFKKNLHGQYR